MKHLSLLLLCCTFFSCSDNTEVEIRLKNDTTSDFENATYNQVDFGSIDAGQYSDYNVFSSSYSYGSFNVTIQNETYRLIPIDFVGEELLESGKYTFELKVDQSDNNLIYKLIHD